ncbi:MAG: Cof-type HAD-IIB family hydrolase [Clostridium sp.]|nr:Cof-type HAD-IIB family hydrolase [Clostridium sp.]
MMKNKYDGYVIYTDLDGTLLNDEKEVPEKNKEAINYFIENGGRFSIATGRAFESTEKYIENIKIDLPAIVYNGGAVYDCADKIAVREKFIENNKKEIVNKVLADYKDLGIEIYSNTDVYVFNNNGMSERPATLLLNIIYEMPDNLFELNWNKILLVGKKEFIDEFQYEFKDKYGTNVIRSGDRFLEILPDNTSKGSGLKEIIKLYKLDKNKVIAAGDDMNDAEMLKECGIAFCPENASDAVKKYADHITINNNEGVIYSILKYLEKN